jgi:hypothetical protein
MVVLMVYLFIYYYFFFLGITYIQIDQRIGATFSSRKEKQTFTLESVFSFLFFSFYFFQSVSYQYFQLNITGLSGGSSLCQLAEIVLGFLKRY